MPADPANAQIRDERVADVNRQRHPVLPVTFAVYQQLARPPIDVVELDRGDLPGAQPQPPEQQQDHQIPASDRALGIAARQHRSDPLGRHPLRKRPAPQIRDVRHRPHQRRLDQSRHVQIAQQRPQLRRQIHRPGHRPPRALSRQEPAHIRGPQPPQLEPADPPDAILQESPRGTLVVTDRPSHQPPLARQVHTEVGEQLLNRPRPSSRRRDRAHLPQIRKRNPHARPSHIRAIASLTQRHHKSRRDPSVKLTDRQALALQPAAQLTQLPQPALDRPTRVPPRHQPPLIPVRAWRQRPGHARNPQMPPHRYLPSDQQEPDGTLNRGGRLCEVDHGADPGNPASISSSQPQLQITRNWR